VGKNLCPVHGVEKSLFCQVCFARLCPQCAVRVGDSLVHPECSKWAENDTIIGGLDYYDIMAMGLGSVFFGDDLGAIALDDSRPSGSW